MNSTKSIYAGLHGEFYIVTTFATGATTVSQSFTTFDAACKFLGA